MNRPYRNKQPYCAHCKNIGLPFNSHFLRETHDSNSPIICPVLLNTECRFCKKKGHTKSKCPSIVTNRILGIPKNILNATLNTTLLPTANNLQPTYASIVKLPLTKNTVTKNTVTKNTINWADDCSSDSDDNYF